MEDGYGRQILRNIDQCAQIVDLESKLEITFQIVTTFLAQLMIFRSSIYP